MEYRRFQNTIVVRMDRGEEILEELQRLCEEENVRLAEVSALGALEAFTCGAYSVAEQRYYQKEYAGVFEIVSLTGNVNTMNGAYYSHLHLSAANEKGEVFGGHLTRAVISATCEMFLRVIDGTVDRLKDEKTGLNLFRFE